MEGLSALPEPGTAGIGSLEYGGLQNQGWRGSGSNLREPWDALMQAAFGDSVVARQMKALAALRAGDAQTAHEQTMPIAMDLASFVGNIKPVGGPIRAYHGSPHDFDKFSMDKIGAGEGAQAYGHGLYFAENEGVARGYRDSLRHKASNPALMQEIRANIGLGDTPEGFQAAGQLFGLAMDPSPNVNPVVVLQSQFPSLRGDAAKAAILDAYDKLRSAVRGRMYEVNIHADPERFLDWDKPLSGQSGPVKTALEQFYPTPRTKPIGPDMLDLQVGGRTIGAFPKSAIEGNIKRLAIDHDPRSGALAYESSWLTPGDNRNSPAASGLLRDAGIPGIKYLDAGSRSAGDGTRNYVVFDDKLIEILRKYGIGGILAGGAGAAGIGSLDESGL